MFLIEEQHVLTSQPYYFIYHNVNMQICVSVPTVIMYYLIITIVINLHFSYHNLVLFLTSRIMHTSFQLVMPHI